MFTEFLLFVYGFFMHRLGAGVRTANDQFTAFENGGAAPDGRTLMVIKF